MLFCYFKILITWLLLAWSLAAFVYSLHLKSTIIFQGPAHTMPEKFQNFIAMFRPTNPEKLSTKNGAFQNALPTGRIWKHIFSFECRQKKIWKESFYKMMTRWWWWKFNPPLKGVFDHFCHKWLQVAFRQIPFDAFSERKGHFKFSSVVWTGQKTCAVYLKSCMQEESNY